jgi:hypothetical protein
MIRIMSGLPANVLGVEAAGEVSDDDYKLVLLPAIRERVDAGEKIRVIYVLGEQFEGWTLGAMLEDAKLGAHLGVWEKIAVVSDHDWLKRAVKAFGWMMPGDVRTFTLAELDAATEWTAS